LDTAGHTRTRRGPDVARGPDVVHHWFRGMDALTNTKLKTRKELVLNRRRERSVFRHFTSMCR